MPVVVWRIGHYPDLIVVDSQLALRVFDDDGVTCRVSNDMMNRYGSPKHLLDFGIADDTNLWHCLPHFGHRGKVAGQIIGDIHTADC